MGPERGGLRPRLEYEIGDREAGGGYDPPMIPLGPAISRSCDLGEG